MVSHRLKFKRAGEHQGALEAAVEAWLDSGAYTIVREIEPETGYTVRRAKITEAPPDSLGLVLGDLLHNLRAALDHVVYAVAEKNMAGRFTPTIGADLAFPIVGNVNRHGAAAKGADIFKGRAAQCLSGVPGAARDFIEQEQPYRHDVTGTGYLWHELWLLHDLDRIDKHRRLNLTTAWLQLPVATLSDPQSTPRITFSRGEGPIKDGDKIVTYSGAEEGVQTHLTRDIALDEGPESSSYDLLLLVEAIGRRVSRVLAGLERFL